MNKGQLAEFLRSRRERLRPEDLGLPSGTRRRTPGLRREEIAVLAHISTEYYVRLEQGRAPRPSTEVLAGIAGALRLTDAESDHLYLLAGTAPAQTGLHRRDVRPSILALLERLPQTAGIVLSAAFEVLAWNNLGAALMEDFALLQPHDRNLARKAFLRPEQPNVAFYGISDDAAFREGVVTQLRSTQARYPSDPVVARLIHDLLDGSDEFQRLWARQDVQGPPPLRKTFRNTAVGGITVDCDSLAITDRDQYLVLYTAPLNTRDAENLALLSVIGTQTLMSHREPRRPIRHLGLHADSRVVCAQRFVMAGVPPVPVGLIRSWPGRTGLRERVPKCMRRRRPDN